VSRWREEYPLSEVEGRPDVGEEGRPCSGVEGIGCPCVSRWREDCLLSEVEGRPCVEEEGITELVATVKGWREGFPKCRVDGKGLPYLGMERSVCPCHPKSVAPVC
jgi:hypothetical protein